VDDISNIPNYAVFEFADIDRDGMIDMLFITSRTMNFIINYNMLKNPSGLNDERLHNLTTQSTNEDQL